MNEKLRSIMPIGVLKQLHYNKYYKSSNFRVVIFYWFESNYNSYYYYFSITRHSLKYYHIL